MRVGKVMAHIVATQKNEKLLGCKFMIVRLMHNKLLSEESVVAVDQVGAGEGELVLVAFGSAARVGREDAPIDASIVGIVDQPAGMVESGDGYE